MDKKCNLGETLDGQEEHWEKMLAECGDLFGRKPSEAAGQAAELMWFIFSAGRK